MIEEMKAQLIKNLNKNFARSLPRQFCLHLRNWRVEFRSNGYEKVQILWSVKLGNGIYEKEEKKL